VASAGVLDVSRADGILANTTAPTVCITSDLPVMCPSEAPPGLLPDPSIHRFGFRLWQERLSVSAATGPTSQSLIKLSPLPEAKIRPSGLKATL
jgi:hypothetical protein